MQRCGPHTARTYVSPSLQSHRVTRVSVGARREVTHLTSVTVCLSLMAQIALRDSSPAEDSPAVSHKLVLTKTLTFNGVLVILDVSLVTVAVTVVHPDYSGGITFNINSHSTRDLLWKTFTEESSFCLWCLNIFLNLL